MTPLTPVHPQRDRDSYDSGEEHFRGREIGLSCQTLNIAPTMDGIGITDALLCLEQATTLNRTTRVAIAMNLGLTANHIPKLALILLSVAPNVSV